MARQKLLTQQCEMISLYQVWLLGEHTLSRLAPHITVAVKSQSLAIAANR